MEVTLRKAARLIGRIDGKVQELAAKLYETPTTTIFVRDEDTDITRRISKAQKDCTKLLAEIYQLTDIRRILRTRVGTANEENGVNALVTQIKSVEQQLLITRNLRNRAVEPVLSDRELKNRLKALRERASTTSTQLSIRGMQDDTKAEFNTLDGEKIDRLDLDIETFTSTLANIQDQLERINNITTVEIDDSDVTILRQSIVL